MEEKLFMKPGKKLLNVASRQKRRMEKQNSCLRSRAKMRSLADLASGFVLSFYVGMGRSLRNKYNKDHSETKGQQPSQSSPRFWPIKHYYSQTTLSLPLTKQPLRVRGEPRRRLQSPERRVRDAQ